MGAQWSSGRSRGASLVSLAESASFGLVGLRPHCMVEHGGECLTQRVEPCRISRTQRQSGIEDRWPMQRGAGQGRKQAPKAEGSVCGACMHHAQAIPD